MARDNRRRQVIVEGFQARFVVVQLLWVVGGLLVFAAVLLGPLIYSLLTAGPAVSTAVADQFLLLHSTLWPVLLGLTAMLAAVFVRMSHRVAGPLVRFRRAFRDIGDGRLDIVVTTRPGDYLSQEQADLNAMIVALRERVQDSQKAVAELDSLLADRSAHERPLTRDDVDLLRTRVHRVSSTLSRFVVGSRGFSLVELLIVVCIISVLLGLAVPAYTSALETARVARATGDIHAIQQDVMTHFVRLGCLPGTLADIGRDTLLDPWGHAYVYGVIGRTSGGAADFRSDPRDRIDVAEWGRPRVVRAAYYGPSASGFLFTSGDHGGGRGDGGNDGGNGDGGNGGGGNGGGGAVGGCAACNSTCLRAGDVRKDRRLVPLNRDFDLYSQGKDGRSQGPLTAQVSLDDVIRANNGGFIGLGRNY